MHKLDYIIFSSIDWTTHWQLHHQLTTSLVSTGNRVLFVENTGVRSVSMHDISRLRERIANWRKGLHGFRSINDDSLTLYSPILLPFPYSKFSLFVNKKIFNLFISRWMKASNFDNVVVISFLPTPLIQSAIKSIDPKLTIYYCANNMADSSASASKVRPYEDHFFKSVDIIFTAAYVIQEYALRFSNKVFYFPPGIDFEKFEVALKDKQDIPNDIKKITGPIVGYIGTLGKVLDQKLLCTLIDQCSNFTFVFIGPKYTNIDILEAKSNTVFLGVKPHDQLPYYIKSFNVGIVPYVCNKFTEGVYPSKLNEYLAMGIPAVSTNLKEVREAREEHGKTKIIANNTDEFINAVKSSVLDQSSILLKEQRIKTAKENSWESRFKGISKIIEEELIIIENSQIAVNWKKRFESYFHLRSKRRKLLFTFIFSFLVIFYSPLFWFMGEQLIVRNAPVKADAIVVFSGDGQVSYQNLSYQKRSLDAIKFYESGYANKIFLSSGREQTISDVEMIKLYLISKGVHESSIYILDKYPDSTYQNIMMVKQSLDNENVSSILFLTSPYHSLRSILTWSKNAPNIKVVIPEVVDSPSKIMQWSTSFKDVRVIFYEFIAIAHNWIVGRV
jgi:uncharacterized SAM-binding protein YcdF (DUF218 family)/glycosyltransferase involved in cell wall biosynthesis